MNETLSQIRVERNFLHLIKYLSKKSTTHIVFNDETRYFPVKIRNKAKKKKTKNKK